MGDLFGRFHPLVVHFPIGILIVAALLGLFLDKTHFTRHRFGLRILYLTGSLFAVLSVCTGLYLAPLSSYEEDNLFWHKWSAIGLTVIGLLLYWQTKPVRSKLIFPSLNAVLLLMLTITGHLGGKMTHGPDYLIPAKTKDSADHFIINDSTVLFEGLVLPILQSKCIRCHQSKAKNGGLDLSSYEALKAGSDEGLVIELGHAGKSELFKRVSLPANHPRFMPPNGPGLTYDEMRLLEWWLDNGASPDKKIGHLVPSPGIAGYLEKFGWSSKTEDPLAGITVPALPAGVLDSLNDFGFKINTISAHHNLLDVIPRKPNQALSGVQLAALLNAKEQIVWLNLAGTQLNDESMRIIGQLVNLRKLHLERNPITDQGLEKLSALVQLEYLNVYGTGITDQGIGYVGKLLKLQELFIGQTRVTENGVKTLQTILPDLEVVDDTEAFKIIK